MLEQLELLEKEALVALEALEHKPVYTAAGEVLPGLARCETRTHGCSATGMSTGSGLDNGSRMTRECHVRICGGLGGQFPGATRQQGPPPGIQGGAPGLDDQPDP